MKELEGKMEEPRLTAKGWRHPDGSRVTIPQIREMAKEVYGDEYEEPTDTDRIVEAIQEMQQALLDKLHAIYMAILEGER